MKEIPHGIRSVALTKMFRAASEANVKTEEELLRAIKPISDALSTACFSKESIEKLVKEVKTDLAIF